MVRQILPSPKENAGGRPIIQKRIPILPKHFYFEENFYFKKKEKHLKETKIHIE